MIEVDLVFEGIKLVLTIHSTERMRAYMILRSALSSLIKGVEGSYTMMIVFRVGEESRSVVKTVCFCRSWGGEGGGSDRQHVILMDERKRKRSTLLYCSNLT